MIIYAKVKPGSKENNLKKISENEYLISVKERAEDGKANNSVIKMLASYFNVFSKDILIKNHKSRRKIIEIVK